MQDDTPRDKEVTQVRRREIITRNDIRVGSLLMSKAIRKGTRELWMVTNIREEDAFVTVKKIYCNYGARHVLMVIPFDVVHNLFVCVD